MRRFKKIITSKPSTNATENELAEQDQITEKITKEQTP
jgi:hypothetical protein